MQIKLEPATGASLSPNTKDAVTQVLRISNSMHGQVKYMLNLEQHEGCVL